MTASRWAALIERHHRAILAGSLALCLLAALSLTRLRLDVDVLGMLPRGEPAFDDFKTFVADFGELDELLILVDGPRSERERVADGLAAALARLDTIGSVQGRLDTAAASDALLGPFLFNYLPVDDYTEVHAQLTPAGIAAQVAADKALLAAPFDVSLARTVAADPLGLRRIAALHLAAAAGDALPDLDGGYLTARDGNALLLIARPNGSAFDAAFTARLLAQVETAVAAARTDAPVRVSLTGSYLFAREDAATMRADVQRYVVLALLAVLAVFWLGYGNLRVLPFVAYPLALSTLLAFALSLLVYDQLNVLSLCFAAILYGLSIDSGIHFYGRLLEAHRRHPDDACAAVAETIASIGWANVASSSTTAAAFLVVALSCLAVVRQLGVLTATGMAITTAQFFVLYPALGFVWLRRARRDAAAGHAAPRRVGRRRPAARRRGAARRPGAGAARHAGRQRGAARSLAAAAAPGRLARAAGAGRDRRRFARPDRGGAVLVGAATTEGALVGGERVAAHLREWHAAGLLANLQTVDALLPSAATQRARLAEYNALPRAAALRDLDAALRARASGPSVSPPSPTLRPAARRRGHARLAGTGGVRPGDRAPRARAAGPDDGRPLCRARARHRVGRHRRAPAYAAARPRPRGGGAAALLEDTLRGVLRRELRLFIGLAVLANLALLAWMLRSVRTGAAVLAPVLLVVVLVFAAMRVAGMAIDPINLVVTPLLLGIGVDNGAYVVSAARELGDVGAALRACGRALCLTSFTTIAGFGFLALSTYPPLASLGALMALGLLLALATTIFVLPALLAPGDAPRRPRAQETRE
ncbi:MAG: MMPL family transporter [Candidatus Binatia bacterium]